MSSLCNEPGLRLSQKKHRIHINREHSQVGSEGSGLSLNSAPSMWVWVIGPRVRLVMAIKVN